MTALLESLAARIRLQGALTIADYMTEVLTHPQHGYYMSGDPFGAPRESGGDFVTAPEISQMFGELAGLWAAETWDRLGRPPQIQLLELGPGRGTLLADALRALKGVPDFRQALSLHLVEVSPALQQRQAETLQPLADGLDMTWYGNLGEVPEGPMILIANEFFDALPIRQFQRLPEGWSERVIVLDPEAEAGEIQLAFAQAQPDPGLERLLPPGLQAADEGALVEVSSAGQSIAGEVGRRLRSAPGAALIIDYGHIKPRIRPTLQAIRRHRPHAVLEEPGCADLTAHVDFASLAAAARSAGARTHGPVSQGAFLKRLGIEARCDALMKQASYQQAEDLMTAKDRLIGELEMGSLFRVLGLSAPDLTGLAGFESPP